MTFKLNSLSKSELEFEVTIPFSEFEPGLREAAALISEEVEVKGFRKGKAPLEVIKNRVGEYAVYERAAQLVVEKTYPGILQKILAGKELPPNRPPIGKPEITITKLAPSNDFQYKVKLVLLPEVKLPDYKFVARLVNKEKREVSVTEDEITKTLEWIRESRSEGEGENRKLPELNDEFAKSLGKFSTLVELKESIREGIRMEKEFKERERMRMKIIEKIAAESQIEVPDLLIEAELDKMLEELKSGVENLGMKWEDYLFSHIRKDPAELRKEWRADAEKRVRTALCLRAIAEREGITVSSEEIKEKADEFLRQFADVKEAENTIDPERLKEYSKNVLRNEKVFEFLEQV